MSVVNFGPSPSLLDHYGLFIVHICTDLMVPGAYYLLEELICKKQDTLRLIKILPLFGKYSGLLGLPLLDQESLKTFWTYLSMLFPFPVSKNMLKSVGIFIDTLLSYPDPHFSKPILLVCVKQLFELCPTLKEVNEDVYQRLVSHTKRTSIPELVEQAIPPH